MLIQNFRREGFCLPSARALAVLLLAVWSTAACAIGQSPGSRTTAVERAAETCTAHGLVPASAVADSALLRGPWHEVAPCARIAGHLAYFRIDSVFGPIQADGVEMLAIRVDELSVLAQIADVTHTSVAWGAARDRGERTAKEASRAWRQPIATIKGIPAGLWRFVRGKFDSLRRESRKLADDTADELTGADDAYDDVSLRPGVTLPAGGHTPWWQRKGKRIERYALRRLDYPALRRTWSRELGVDPYTTNPLLDDRMDTLAWSAVAGDRGARYAIGLIGGGAGELLSTSRKLNELVWELPAAKVSERNAQRLALMDCGDIEVRRFLRNGKFSPSLQTAVVDALVELQPVEGCVHVMDIAAALETEIEARYLVNALRMLSAYGGTHLPRTDPRFDVRPEVPSYAESAATAVSARRNELAPHANTGGFDDSPARDDMPLDVEIRDGTLVTAPLDVDISDRRRSLATRAIVLIDTTPALREADGTIVLPLAVDRLQWTRSARRFFDQQALSVPRRLVLLAGEASPAARRALHRRGWPLRQHVAFAGAPPYAVDTAPIAQR